MTERAATVILVTGIVLTAASAAGLSTVAVAEGWLSRLALPELATTPATAMGLAAGAVLVVAAFLALAVAILGPPQRARKLRVAVSRRRRPGRLPARSIGAQPASAGAGRDITALLPPVPPRTPAGRYTVGQAQVYPAPGLADPQHPSVPLRGGHGRAGVGASAPRRGVEAPTLSQPRLPDALPPARQSVTAPVPARRGAGTGAAPPCSGGGRGVAASPQAWAAADRHELSQIRTGRGAANTAALDETAN